MNPPTAPPAEKDSAALPVRAWLGLLAAAALTRLAYFGEHSGSVFFLVPQLDQRYYADFAQAIAEGADLRSFGGFRPLLYPAFLSLFYAVASGAGAALLAVVAQHALGIATIGCVAAAGARMAGNWRAGVAGGLLYALAPVPLFFEGELLIEPFLASIAAAMFAVLACGVRREGWPRGAAVAAGVLAGLAAQARPNAVLFFPAFALAAMVWRASGAWVMLAAALAVQTAFGFVNAAQSGRYQWMTSAGGVNLYVGNARSADGMIPRQARSVTYEGEYRDSIQVFAEQEFAAATGGDPAADPGAVSRFWTRRALAEIAADPVRWAGLMAKKCWLVSANREVANNKSWSFILEHESVLLRLLPVSWVLMLALAGLGSVGVWRRGDRRLLVLAGCWLGAYAASIALFFVNSRFRVPMWPVAAMLAGAAFAMPSAEWRRLWFVPAAVLAISLPNWFRIPPDDHSRDYFFRALAAIDAGRVAEAEEDARKSLALDPSNADTALTLANALYLQRKYDAARTILEELSVRDGAEPRVWNNLGAVEEDAGRFAEAYRAYGRALELRGNHPSAVMGAATLEARAGRLDAAEQTLARLGPNPPPSPRLAILRAVIAYRRGDAAAGERLKALHAEFPALVESATAPAVLP